MKYTGFIERFEAELTKMLRERPSEIDAIVKWASDKVFESYRNGVSVGKNGKPVRTKRPNETQPQAA